MKKLFLFSSMYRPLEEQGVLLGTSVEDYTAFFNAMKRSSWHAG